MVPIVDLRGIEERRAVVTGCAGFIGSHLCERLVADGCQVVGIDSFSSYYDRGSKLGNLAQLAGERDFELVEMDLATADLRPAMASAPLVFHIAGQPGVRASFGDSFAQYASDNIVATQRVFEAAADAGCERVVWASSSSVYGDAATYPCVEATTPTRPRSPYGVTKRACEDLASVYRQQGLMTVGLRYFSVYGPRQRPDMAVRRICEALVSGAPFSLFGDGTQTRDITYVLDVVAATVLAARASEPFPIYNVGGGHEVSLNEVIAVLEELAGRTLQRTHHHAQAGDVRRTAADTTAARSSLGWRPRVDLRTGLGHALSWVEAEHAARVA
jgi:nucleoside-diphosphate-sugar epimerase